MVRYFYAWTPISILVGMAVLLCSPLALIALMGVSLVALAALARATVAAPYMLSRAVSRRWHGRTAMAMAPGDLSIRFEGANR